MSSLLVLEWMDDPPTEDVYELHITFPHMPELAKSAKKNSAIPIIRDVLMHQDAGSMLLAGTKRDRPPRIFVDSVPESCVGRLCDKINAIIAAMPAHCAALTRTLIVRKSVPSTTQADEDGGCKQIAMKLAALAHQRKHDTLETHASCAALYAEWDARMQRTMTWDDAHMLTDILSQHNAVLGKGVPKCPASLAPMFSRNIRTMSDGVMKQRCDKIVTDHHVFKR
jgi:hypothetical protein